MDIERAKAQVLAALEERPNTWLTPYEIADDIGVWRDERWILKYPPEETTIRVALKALSHEHPIERKDWRYRLKR